MHTENYEEEMSLYREQCADREEALHDLVKATLTTRQYEMFVYLYRHGMSEKQVSQHLGISQPAVHYGKKRIKAAMLRVMPVCPRPLVEPDKGDEDQFAEIGEAFGTHVYDAKPGIIS